MRVADEVDAAVKRLEHPETEQVELHEPDGGAVLLVPLQSTTARHAGPLHRTDLDHRPVAYDHPPECRPEMAGEVENVRGETCDIEEAPRPVRGIAAVDRLCPECRCFPGRGRAPFRRRGSQSGAGR